MKKIASAISSVALIASSFMFALPMTASAAAFTLGNDANSRPIVDTYSNFTIIDTNNPALVDGQINSFDYYASNTNPFRFVLVDSTNKVLWISDQIIPAGVGPQNFILVTPVVVHTGDNIGMYFAQTGTIPFEQPGSNAIYTPNGNGLPAVNSTLTVEGSNGRVYSLRANGDTTNCTTLTLVSSTATYFKGLTIADPAGSSVDATFGLGTSGAAVVTGPDGFPGAWDGPSNDPNLSGASWVNNNSVAPSNPAGGDVGQNGNENVWRLFSHSFSLPAGSTVNSAMLHFSADNSVTAYLNNVSVGTSPAFNSVTDVALTVGAGNHELEFVTKNDAYDGSTNPTAVIYKAEINYCTPTITNANCPAAPSVANKILKAAGVKSGSTTEKNLIAQVAKEMGAQKNFQGVGACDPLYVNKIQTYLHSLNSIIQLP